MSWLVEVDGDTCIGSGMCVGSAPDHFDLVEGVACVLRPNIDASDEVIDAAESCPVEAITVTEADTGRVMAPGE